LYGVLLLIPTEDHKEKNLVEGGVKSTKWSLSSRS
jgi:hypothetical protein